MMTFEVSIPLLDSGRCLNVLMGAPSADDAKSDVLRLLHEIGVKAGREYDAKEIAVMRCHIQPFVAA